MGVSFNQHSGALASSVRSGVQLQPPRESETVSFLSEENMQGRTAQKLGNDKNLMAEQLAYLFVQFHFSPSRGCVPFESGVMVRRL